MNYSVYAIKSIKDGRIYVGMSSNIKRRLEEHNKKRVKSTKAYSPWHLIFSELVGKRVDTREKERYYKSGVGKEFLKNLNYEGL